MQTTGTLILNEREIVQKLRRMAFEIYERNFQENELVLAGVDNQGCLLAGMLAEELKKISPLQVRLVKVSVENKQLLQGRVSLDCDAQKIAERAIILVDDVMNTGRTMAYSLKPFLNIPVKKLETAVLINRSHKLFPISSNYTGLELSTTMANHIQVKLQTGEMSVTLY
jgi:pyrimidine operon attenuation protein / uracil phosphoribosyltransferase